MPKKIKLKEITVESFITNKRADLIRGASAGPCTVVQCTVRVFCNTYADCSNPCTVLCPPLP